MEARYWNATLSHHFKFSLNFQGAIQFCGVMI